MTAQEAIKQILDLARSELGYHEKTNNSQLNNKTANSGDDGGSFHPVDDSAKVNVTYYVNNQIADS